MPDYTIHPSGDFQTLEDALASVVPGDGIYVVMPLSTTAITVNVDNITLLSGDEYMPALEVTLGAGVAEFQTEGSTNFTVIGNALDNELHAKAGNEVLIGGAGDDVLGHSLFGSALDFGGTEYASYEYDPAGVTVTLLNNVGFATDGYGDSDTLWGIEGLIGSQFDDVLQGNDLDNILIGLGGDDTLNGGFGTDTVSYEMSMSGGVTVDLANRTATDSFGGQDTLISIENIIGSDFADALTGSYFVLPIGALPPTGSGFLVGSEIFGGGGDDIIDGGIGFDTVSYNNGRADQGAVNVNLLTGIATDGLGGTDTLISIERVVGTDLNDVLIGGTGDDTFVGGAGDDTIDGGDGFDTVEYLGHHSLSPRIVVNLALGTATDSYGGQDTLSNIEGVIGSNFADTLIGNSEDNHFIGNCGNDIIDGGDGIDTVSYADSLGVTVNLTAGTATLFGNETDTLSNIENIVGSNGFDHLTGNDLDNSFTPGLGPDVVVGGGGFDTVDYSTYPVVVGPLGQPLPQWPDVTPPGTGSVGLTELSTVSIFQTPGVMVDLGAGTITDNAGMVDRITEVERVVGTRFEDTFYDGVGSQTYDAAGGFDLLSYENSASSIHLERSFGYLPTQATRRVTSTDGSVDQISNFESFLGTAHDDVFTISVGSEMYSAYQQYGQLYTFDGGDGHDILNVSLHGLLSNVHGLELRLDYDSGTIRMGAFTVARFTNFEVVNGVDISNGPTLSSDFDGDGDDDVVFSFVSDTNAMINHADGSGSSWIGYAGRTLLDTGDFDGDGDTDLLFQLADGNKLIFNVGQGGTWLGSSDRAAKAVGDFDGDGDDDVVFEFADGNKLIANVGDGNTWLGLNNRSLIATGDFDGDGDDDFLFEFADGNKLISRLGEANIWVGASDRTAKGVGDFDGDGDDDILFEFANGDKLIFNAGVGNTWLGNSDRSVEAVGDFDGDGDDDILFEFADGNKIIANVGSGSTWLGQTNRSATAVGDFDGDGDDDILMELADGNHLIVHVGTGNQWLGFPDRDAIGSDVTGLGTSIEVA